MKTMQTTSCNFNVEGLNGINELHAQPYDTSKAGFYFSTMEEYETKAELSGAEEFEIQFIDGEDCELFNACKIDQSNLERWFDEIEGLNDDEKMQLYFVMECLSYDLDDALRIMGDVCIQEDDLETCAQQLFDECYGHDIPDSIRFYIDYKSFARDVEIEGGMVEFEYNGITYTCTNANGL